MKTIDADAHVLETPYTWEFMEEEDRRFAPMVVRQTSGREVKGNAGNIHQEYWVVDGRMQPKDDNVGINTPEAAREMRDIDARLKHMDELQIDVQVLYPTFFLRPVTKRPEVELALCKGYNRWLAAIWKKAPERMRWVAMAPCLSMDKVRDELIWAKDHGACGIYLRGLEVDRRLSDSYFHPLYSIAEELDLAICLHSGNGSYMVHDFFDDDAFNKFKLAVVGSFHSLVMDGTPSLFPKARWGFIEVSAQWIPYLFNDLDLRFKRRGKRFPQDPLKANNMYVACQVTDDLRNILQYTGEDNLVIGTDYGHSDTSTQIEALRLLRQNGDIEPRIIDKILDDNARALYGL